jgi:hypothetical protein
MATRRKPAGIIDDIVDPAARWAARQAVRSFIRTADNLAPKAKTAIKRSKAIEGVAIKQAKNAIGIAEKKAKGYKKTSKPYKAIVRQGERASKQYAAQTPKKTLAKAGRQIERVKDAEAAAMKHFSSKQRFSQAVREERKLMGNK